MHLKETPGFNIAIPPSFFKHEKEILGIFPGYFWKDERKALMKEVTDFIEEKLDLYLASRKALSSVPEKAQSRATLDTSIKNGNVKAVEPSMKVHLVDEPVMRKTLDKIKFNAMQKLRTGESKRPLYSGDPTRVARAPYSTPLVRKSTAYHLRKALVESWIDNDKVLTRTPVLEETFEKTPYHENNDTKKISWEIYNLDKSVDRWGKKRVNYENPVVRLFINKRPRNPFEVEKTRVDYIVKESKEPDSIINDLKIFMKNSAPKTLVYTTKLFSKEMNDNWTDLVESFKDGYYNRILAQKDKEGLRKKVAFLKKTMHAYFTNTSKEIKEEKPGGIEGRDRRKSMIEIPDSSLRGMMKSKNDFARFLMKMLVETGKLAIPGAYSTHQFKKVYLECPAIRYAFRSMGLSTAAKNRMKDELERREKTGECPSVTGKVD
jgi:hypothetical protein